MQIHWHEGLFLLPHHLQRLQHNLMDDLAEERARTWAYPYGVVESRLARDDLESMRLRFDRLRVIMPSGIELNYPDNAELPAIDIKEPLAKLDSFTVHLAVPLWFAARANCVVPGTQVDPRAKILYRVVEGEWADENSGGNAKPILERRINARLLIGDEDRSDLETIPLLKISRSGEELGLPKQDPEFVGPCLVLSGSSTLRDLVRDLSGQIQAGRQELVLQITRGGFDLNTVRGAQIEQMMRLRTLNKYAGRLEALLAIRHMPTFLFYLELNDLLAELGALYPDRDLYDIINYNHDDPYPVFNELVRKIRMLIHGSVAPNFLKVAFDLEDGLRRAALTEEHFTAPNEYFLGIRTREDPVTLARFVENEDRFKLMPLSFANRAVRGILLKEERFPPLELPAQTGLYYFRLLRNECAEMWKQIQNEKSAIVRWSGNDEADYQVTLYMTLPRS